MTCRNLHWLFTLLITAGFVKSEATGQPQLPPDSNRVTRQCSLIRELISIGHQQHFAPIVDREIGSTRGYQPSGAWEFATIRYGSTMQWPGANRTYLENYNDKTATGIANTWQYIAEYNRITSATAAIGIYNYLNKQIEGCRFPLNDSTDIDFEPLPLSMLPPDRPAMLETASLYNLPRLGLDANSTIHVMVGMEKRANSYNVSLIVENVVNTKNVADSRKKSVSK
jgi:hypothetical protein